MTRTAGGNKTVLPTGTEKKRQEDGTTTCLLHGTLATIIGKAKALYDVKNFTIFPSTI